MKIYPAIDLKEGKCVRLYKGDMNQATIFNDNPLNQAQYFANNGFDFLHIVDLDGAISGSPVNSKIIKNIINNSNVKIQLGGGIRSIKSIESWLNCGVSKVIIGTAALKNPDLVKEAAKNFPNQIIVGIDAKDDFVAVSGWVEESKIKVTELAKRFEDAEYLATEFIEKGANSLKLKTVNWSTHEWLHFIKHLPEEVLYYKGLFILIYPTILLYRFIAKNLVIQ